MLVLVLVLSEVDGIIDAGGGGGGRTLLLLILILYYHELTGL